MCLSFYFIYFEIFIGGEDEEQLVFVINDSIIDICKL